METNFAKKIAKKKSGLSAVPNYLVSCMDPASRDILDKQKLEDHLGEITKVNSETEVSKVVIKMRLKAQYLTKARALHRKYRLAFLSRRFLELQQKAKLSQEAQLDGSSDLDDGDDASHHDHEIWKLPETQLENGLFGG